MTSTTDSCTFAIGGDLPVRRLGYGSMQLTGPGHWDLPADPDAARRLLRAAVHDHGVNHLGTADAYGPHTVETLLREALHPYPDDLLIATKGGLARPGPNIWRPCGRPEYLTQCAELSLRVDTLDLYYLHRIDPLVPLADQLGAIVGLQRAGKIRHVGLSKVTVDQVEQDCAITGIAAVQNQHAVTSTDPVLDYCTTNGLAYVAFKPFGAAITPPSTGNAVTALRPVEALRTLLARSPAMLVVPGTSSVEHLRVNCAVDHSVSADENTTACRRKRA
ncbi:oxidoreductase [Actinoplanes cyaneus]|uniref:Oxidoreductase n=1 Tax=Actinoplanes cyaneus TaxID=52696 RepID=A0A919IVC4_9ACTN|nr:aldo/keto reductase [Actinoplanes cyaneus]MCW2144479.1 putative oxidoreductase [Actinoplanes cyaneus]GID71177.1 oxidoreductase [Actinoplanes cyaneus]